MLLFSKKILIILRNLTENLGGREGGKKYSYKQRGREANHKIDLKTEGEQTGGCWGGWGEGKMSDEH